jgi:hypothetical protein
MHSSLPAVQACLTCVETSSRKLIPLWDEEPAVRDQFIAQLLNGLSPILCKVSPGLTDDAAGRWRVAMAQALSDLPGAIVLEAVQRSLSAQLRVEPNRRADTATYRPIQRVSEIETLIRQQADRITRRGAIPPRPNRNAPAAVSETPCIATQSEVDELNSIMRRFGIERRWRLGIGSTLEPILTEAEIKRQRRRQCLELEQANAATPRRE